MLFGRSARNNPRTNHLKVISHLRNSEVDVPPAASQVVSSDRHDIVGHTAAPREDAPSRTRRVRQVREPHSLFDDPEDG